MSHQANTDHTGDRNRAQSRRDDDRLAMDIELANATPQNPRAALIAEQVLALLHEDRISELLSLIAPPDVGMLAMDNPALWETLVVALSAVQWQSFDQAVFFYGLLSSGGRDGEHFAVFEELSGLRESWLDVCRHARHARHPWIASSVSRG